MSVVERVSDHPQAIGILGVAFGVIGVAVLVSTSGRLGAFLAGYSLGASMLALGFQLIIIGGGDQS